MNVAQSDVSIGLFIGLDKLESIALLYLFQLDHISSESKGKERDFSLLSAERKK